MNHLVGSYCHQRNAFLATGSLSRERIVDNGIRNILPIIHGELMVKIMVPFAHREDRGDEVVARGMFVIVWRTSKVVRDGVDAERALS